MADIFVSYTRADQEIVRKIVSLLEAQGWSIWWDTRIGAGERWDATIEREIKAARCVVVVWTPQSADREWVREEADHGRKRGVLVPILIDLDVPPFGFGLIQALNLTGWNGMRRSPAVIQLLADVRHKLDETLPQAPFKPHLQPEQSVRRQPQQSPADRIKVDAGIVRGARGGWFLPGAGKLEWFKDVDVGPEMVVVPSGEFTMGSHDSDHESENPLHKVTIGKAFAVGRFAVTFAEWDAAGLPYKPSDEGWGRGRRPVINVSWDDATAFAMRLLNKTGKEYRLLSEAEWEYCCRAGTTTNYAFGDTINPQQAHFAGTQTLAVGEFQSNAWGLHDMHGNVHEWCEDDWHDDYRGAPQDGSVWEGGDASFRVLRGGSWSNVPLVLRSAHRSEEEFDARFNNVGFRLARAL